MDYKLEVNKPNLPQGASVFVDGLGTFANGAKSSVSEKQVRSFEAKHNVKFDKAVAAMYGVSRVQASSPQGKGSGEKEKEGAEA